jgi:ferredoxin/truncated hemoglobin YjbI
MSTSVATLDGRRFEVRAGETLLDACRRNGVPIDFSCMAGVCHTCLLQAQTGQVPAAAAAGLTPQLRAKGYLLACRCRPDGDLALLRPDPRDRTTTCLLYGVERTGPFLLWRFATERALRCGPGQRLLLDIEGCTEELEVTATNECDVEALLRCAADSGANLVDLPFGYEFRVSGPLDRRECAELHPPSGDPQLWTELSDGRTVRAVLEDFYAVVYADPQLSPFFAGVTIERSIDKQYSFLRQLMTGERVYFGDRPRNAHHWMVISGALFEHRQALMRQALERHELSEGQRARWARLEAHYRGDIVKSKPWPRRVGGVDIDTDGYGLQVLDEPTVCDHCGAPVEAGVEVRYHLRLGDVSCPHCMSEALPDAA